MIQFDLGFERGMVFHIDDVHGNRQAFPPKANMICSQFPLCHINMTLFYLVTLSNEKQSNHKCLQYLPLLIFWNTDYVLI